MSHKATALTFRFYKLWSIALSVTSLALILSSTVSAQTNFPYPNSNYDEALRGQFHFSPEGGWMNDINGVWYWNGLYHMGYQSFPYGLGWNSMNWGHATSPDMMHWTQQPLMLQPNVNVPGDCWSGSTVVDVNNTSGLKTGSNPVFVTLYTSTSEGTCMAYSNDLGSTWQAYAGNPIANIGTPNSVARDPHVFWYVPTSTWVCLLYQNGTTFYISPDLKNWTQVSNNSFGYECPDLYQLPIDGNLSNQKWVLQSASGQYLLGQFNGTAFTPDAGGPYSMDVGPDFYAGQSFYGATFPTNRVVQMAWNSHWSTSTPPPLPPSTQPWSRNATFPCQLTLVTFPEGVRLARQPIAEISKLYGTTRHLGTQALKSGQNIFDGLSSKCFDLQVVLNVSSAQANTITFKIANDTFSYDITNQLLLGLPLKSINNQITVRILCDWSQLEIFGNNGEFSYSQNLALTPSDSTLSVTANGSIGLVSADFRKIKRTWPGTAAPVIGTTIDDADPSVDYSGPWSTATDTTYFMSTCHYGNTTNAYFSAPFKGTSVQWWGLKNEDLGLANIYIDSNLVATGIDCYSATRATAMLYSGTGFSDANHTIKVVASGTKNASSNGTFLVNDYFVYFNPDPPASPTGLTSTGGNPVNLAWTASSFATSYNVYRGTTTGAESSTPIASGVAGTSYSDTSLNSGGNFYYTVAAVDNSGISGYSNEINVVVSPP